MTEYAYGPFVSTYYQLFRFHDAMDMDKHFIILQL